MASRQSRLDIIIRLVKQGKGAEDIEKELKELENTTHKNSRASDILNVAWGNLIAQGSMLALNILKQIPAFVSLAQQYDRSKVALEAFAGGSREAAEILEAVTSASDGALNKLAATENATRLLSLGLATTAEEAGQLTDIAITLGSTMGRDVQTSFEEFTLLLANQSILRLDTFGISGAKVRQRMDELAESMPEADRQTRFLTATMEIATDKMDELAAAGYEATTSADRMAAQWYNVGLAIGGGVPLVDKFNEGLRIVGVGAEIVIGWFGGDEADHALDVLTGMGDVTEEFAIYLEDTTDSLDGYRIALGDVAVTAEILAGALKGPIREGTEKIAEATAELAAITNENQLAQATLTAQYASGEITLEQYNSAMDRLIERQTKAEDKVLDLKDALRETTKEMIFQQATAGLDPQTSLEVARALGMIDEETYAVLTAAQTLREELELGIITTDEFVQEVYLLDQAVANLQDKGIEITVDTIQAEMDILRIVNYAESTVITIPVDFVSKSVTTTPILSDTVKIPTSTTTGVALPLPFQTGGEFVVGGKGRGDRQLVSFNAEAGEKVTITPNTGFGPSGGRDVTIQNVNLGDGVALAMLEDMLKNI